MICGQYILADRFLMNSGYQIDREILVDFCVTVPSKRSFENSKNSEVCLNFTIKWRRPDAFWR